MEAQDAGPAPAPNAAPIDETLSSISATSTAITRFLRSVRAAHADLAAVTRELSDLRLLLELIRDEQDMPLLLQAQVLALLQDCRGILLRVRDTLEHCSTPAQWTSSIKPDMTALRQSLEIFRRALGLVLEFDHLYDDTPLNSPIHPVYARLGLIISNLNTSLLADLACRVMPPKRGR